MQPLLGIRISDDDVPGIVECMAYIRNLPENKMWKSFLPEIDDRRSYLLNETPKILALLKDVSELMNGPNDFKLSNELATKYKKKIDSAPYPGYYFYERLFSCKSDLTEGHEEIRGEIIETLKILPTLTASIAMELRENKERAIYRLEDLWEKVLKNLKKAKELYEDYHKILNKYVGCFIGFI